MTFEQRQQRAYTLADQCYGEALREVFNTPARFNRWQAFRRGDRERAIMRASKRPRGKQSSWSGVDFDDVPNDIYDMGSL